MSWTSCMKDKIVDHYGPEVKECVEGITEHNYKDVLECIANVLKISNPDVWIPEQLAYFTKWSLECEF